MLIRIRLIEKVTRLAPLTGAVSHRYRLAILYLLAHGSKYTWELAEHLLIKEPLAAHHLKKMVEAGWVHRIRTGRHVAYELENNACTDLVKFLGDTPYFRSLFSKK